MKKLCLVLAAVAALVTLPTRSEAYMGAAIGVIDEDTLGYGLVFGGGLAGPIGLDLQLIGFADTGTVDNYWIQGNVDLSYDFHSILEKVFSALELHPYAKGGFTYAASLLNGGIFNFDANHGPGFNFGAGVDWKLAPFVTIGLDLTENIIFANGIVIDGIQATPDRTLKSFNVFGVVKFGAY